ncbi:hypothetical protein MMC07_008667 [Pseudocyphellaria aurata]|nr:hypothetical protein [Pseudocyphellaria aurata]
MPAVPSGRPETSAPGDSSLTQESVSALETTTSLDDDGSYIPHVFDFIDLAKHAARYTSSSIPVPYLEPQAVDTSTPIGYGASFTASRHSIPEADNFENTVDDDGLVISVKEPQSRLDCVVYKTARVAFTSTGEPKSRADSKVMSSVLMEILALVHPPLLLHPNIVDFIGLAWGSNPFEPTHRLPIVVVEFAHHGTLADLQEKVILPSALRQSLCLDVASGLEILHRCGIVHGDVKSENVLIFSHPERQYIAKVADFGFSVVAAAADLTINVGGTRPWKAPEANNPVPKAQLKQTDVYSFGLLVWRVAADGKSPFDFFLPCSTQDECFAEIERIKQDDELKAHSELKTWYPVYVRKRSGFGRPLTPPEMMRSLEKFTSDPQLMSSAPDELDFLLSSGISAMLSQGSPTDLLENLLLQRAQNNTFYGNLDAILGLCLRKDPEQRDLAGVISLLGGSVERSVTMASGEKLLLSKSYNHHSLSWQTMRDLEPSVQRFVFDTFLRRSEQHAEMGLVRPSDCFILASFYINGYGTEQNWEKAAQLLNHAAKWGHEQAQAYAYRICKVVNEEYVADDVQTTHLVQTSIMGSRIALQDLEEVAPQKVPFIKTKLPECLAGIGANFFYNDQMLHGLAHWPWMDMLADRSSIAEKLKGVKNKAEFRVNRRGDRILHIAANCGKLEAIRALLDTYGVEVNQQNDQQETAILCACRAGQVEAAQILLQHGADASITTPSKESPLHWLVSFTGDDVKLIGEALIANGANIRLVTTENINYSVFPGGLELDHQPPGTSLGWAVHHDRPDVVGFLLESAGDPLISLSKPLNRPTTPLHWAAHSHHVKCLRLMIEALDESKIAFNYSSLIAAAAYNANDFSMMLKHGRKYKAKLKQTFDYLLLKSQNILSLTGIGCFGYTLIYYAVSNASDAVVDYLLSSDALSSLATSLQSSSISTQPKPDQPKEAREVQETSYHVGLKLPASDSTRRTGAFIHEHINQPCSNDRRTPLLESVRWNRRRIFQLLLSHGANPNATARNPFLKDHMDWTALHIFAFAGHDGNIQLCHDLVGLGVSVEGRPPDAMQPETPLTVAIQNNTFKLASSLLSLGADINALSQSSGLIATEHPTTILGHIIASTARHSTPRLRFLLHECDCHESVNFIVEPARKLSALHRAAWAHRGLHFSSTQHSAQRVPLRREEFDRAMNRDVVYELLQRFNAPEELDQRCDVLGRTALHLATEAGNTGAVSELLAMDANAMILDHDGETPAQLAARLLINGHAADQGIETEIKAILQMLKDVDGTA